jgi:FMN-dependent NADH-azoreductase
MTILKVDSSARFSNSNSRVLTQYLIENIDKPFINRDLAANGFPALSAEDLMDMHNKKELDRESLLQHQAISKELLNEIKNVDTLIFGIPIYNFTIPAVLKQWVDYIVRSGITFKYGAQGPEGLSGIKRAFIVTTSGGTTIGGRMDFASPYIEHICKFIGVEDIYHIKADGSKGSSDEIISDGKLQIDNLLAAI